jgi:hypothetical protein
MPLFGQNKNNLQLKESAAAGSPQGSPPEANSVGCEAGRGTFSERETRTEELCEIKWDYLDQ